MEENLLGKLVILTVNLEKWYKELNSEFNVPIRNRLAKVIKVFDWDTEEGKLLLKAREKTDKWNNLDPKEFKYVLRVYYPELKYKGDKVALEEVVPKHYPGTEALMFLPVPDWMLKDMLKEEKEAFRLEENATNVSRPTRGSGIKKDIRV